VLEALKKEKALDNKIGKFRDTIAAELISSPCTAQHTASEILSLISRSSYKAPANDTKKTISSYSLEHAYQLNKKRIMAKELKLLEDEKNYRRALFKFALWVFKNSSWVVLNGTVRYRVYMPNRELDILNLAHNVAVSSIHATDAGCLVNVSAQLEKLGIPHAVIHDSIGAPL
jgi:hypothetical protein